MEQWNEIRRRVLVEGVSRRQIRHAGTLLVAGLGDTGRDIQVERDGKSRTPGRIANPEALITAIQQANSFRAPPR